MKRYFHQEVETAGNERMTCCRRAKPQGRSRLPRRTLAHQCGEYDQQVAIGIHRGPSATAIDRGYNLCSEDTVATKTRRYAGFALGPFGLQPGSIILLHIVIRRSAAAADAEKLCRTIETADHYLARAQQLRTSFDARGDERPYSRRVCLNCTGWSSSLLANDHRARLAYPRLCRVVRFRR